MSIHNLKTFKSLVIQFLREFVWKEMCFLKKPEKPEKPENPPEKPEKPTRPGFFKLGRVFSNPGHKPHIMWGVPEITFEKTLISTSY